MKKVPGFRFRNVVFRYFSKLSMAHVQTNPPILNGHVCTKAYLPKKSSFYIVYRGTLYFILMNNTFYNFTKSENIYTTRLGLVWWTVKDNEYNF